MALGEKNNAIYVSIANGQIVQTFKEPNERTKERHYTTPKGEAKVSHEITYDNITGLITDIKVFENEYGKKWNVMMKDGSEEFIVTMPYSSRYSSIFLKCLPNIDLSQPVKITPKIGKDGKPTLFCNQNNEAIKWAFKKDDGKGLPEMVQIKVKGQLQWDDTDMMEFFEKMVNEEILPKLKKVNPSFEAQAPAKGKTLVTEPIGKENEDESLPF